MLYHYLTISLMIFCLYLAKFLSDSSTKKNDATSWIALLTVSLFWIVLLPLSIWELSKKYSFNQKTGDRILQQS